MVLGDVSTKEEKFSNLEVVVEVEEEEGFMKAFLCRSEEEKEIVM